MAKFLVKTLITGGNGFIGTHLTARLRRAGHQVSTPIFDLRDSSTIREAFSSSGTPDVVIHLAGLSHVPTCQKDPELALEINTRGTQRILDVMKNSCPEACFVFASTAQVYAAAQDDELKKKLVFDESRALAPQNLYARSKREAELALEEASKTWHLRATVLRLFNHSHKSQSQDFFLPSLYHSLLDADAATKIPVGNLHLYRDIGSIHDLMSAFEAVIRLECRPGSVNFFNVCSGSAKHLGKTAELLIQAMGKKVELVLDPSRLRPGEPQYICGSHAKLSEVSEWNPNCLNEAVLIKEFLGAEP